MRTLYVLSVLLVGMAQSQAEPALSEMEIRYVKACMNAGDTAAYCRCELPIARNLATDSQLEIIIRINELPNDQAREEYLQKMPSDEATSILRLAELVNNAALKQCPDVRKQT